MCAAQIKVLLSKSAITKPIVEQTVEPGEVEVLRRCDATKGQFEALFDCLKLHVIQKTMFVKKKFLELAATTPAKREEEAKEPAVAKGASSTIFDPWARPMLQKSLADFSRKQPGAEQPSHAHAPLAPTHPAAALSASKMEVEDQNFDELNALLNLKDITNNELKLCEPPAQVR